IQFRDGFIHRAFCSDTSLGPEDEQERDEIDRDRKFISHLHKRHQYFLFTTFYAANYISSNLKSRNIHFRVSVGPFGNPLYENFPSCTNKTLSVMPSFAEEHYYAMPWGNLKPMCEISCPWEDITPRMRLGNVIDHAGRLLQRFCDKVITRPEGPVYISSCIVDAIRRASTILHFINSSAAASSHSCFHVDFKRTVDQIVRDLCKLKFAIATRHRITEVGVACVSNAAKLLGSLSRDPEMSIPDVVITMNDGEHLLAHAKVRVNEILYVKDAICRGIFTGRLSSVVMKSVSSKGETTAAVLELRMWFGKAHHRGNWERIIEPGRIHYMAEVFENEWCSTIGSRWQASDDSGERYRWTDESRAINLDPSALLLPDGWTFQGEWKTLPCHQMWIGPDPSRIEYEEEVFEVQRRTSRGWKFLNYTNADGVVLPEQIMTNLVCPQGWEWIGEWTIDRTSAGDARGWSYALENGFNEPSSRLDHTEGTEHNFRRRRWRRVRVENADSADKDFDTFRAGVKSAHWEYARAFGHSLHVKRDGGDTYRRRRYVREMVSMSGACRNGKSQLRVNENICISPRIYEVYDEVLRWEMRASILWAYDLVPAGRASWRLFVRVVFMNRCQETAVVLDTMNPIWTETLIFENVLLCGGAWSLCNNPPSVIVEVCSDEDNSDDKSLGQFITKPTVVAFHGDHRGSLAWFPLRQHGSSERCYR
uniref:Ferlin B-domain domain-containing protein n=1 Tax=Parascaris univalens TaxID=6257 RepID=A0A914ZY30_PARUN